MEEAKEEEYISKIVLELQPRSLRGYRRLFGIRENRNELFDIDKLTKIFLNQFNKKPLQRGEHIECEKLILAVKQIQRGYSTNCQNTQVEYRLKGLPFKNQEKVLINEKVMEKKGRSNECFIGDILSKNHQGSLSGQIDQVYSCYCSECKKCLSDGDFFVKSGNWSRPILCLSCYDLLFTHKCVRCTESITFNHNSLTSDGLASIRFVENNGLYWHSACCVCVICLQSLIGRKYYQDQICNQLFCVDHIPNQSD